MTATDPTRVDYFAAHAPPVPDWFSHERAKRRVPKPNVNDYFKKCPHLRRAAESWSKDAIYDFVGDDPLGDQSETARWVADMTRYWDAAGQSDVADKMDRIVQWATAYGRAMAAALTATEGDE